MKTRYLVISAITMAAILWGLATFSARAKTDDQAEIKALEERLVAAAAARNIDGVMSCYVADESLFVFDVIPPRQYVGASAYRKDWEGFLAGLVGRITFELRDFSATTDGKMAYGHNIQHIAASNKSGNKVDLTVRVTDGYCKVKGKWLIAQEHVSVPVDVATGKADLSSKP